MSMGRRGLPQLQVRREFRPPNIQGRAAGAHDADFPILPAWMDESRRWRLHDPRAATLELENETTDDLV